MRKVLAVLATAGMVLTATSVAGATTRRDDSAVSKGEIRVGITYVDLAPVRAAGINRDHGDYEKAWRTVIDDLNKRGGVNGRKIVPVFAGVNPIGTDPAQVACVKLSQDDKVFAVMGQTFGADGPLCYVEQQSMPLLGGSITAEGLSRANAPWYTLERSSGDLATMMNAFAADGQFKKKTVGVVAAATDQSLTEDVVIPALAKNKVKPKTVAFVNAPNDDIPAQRAEMDTIIKRLQADKVDTVVAVEGSIPLLAGRLAETEYRPTILSTSNANVQSYANTAANDTSALANLVAGDVSYPYDEPALVKCRDMVAKATDETMVETPAPGQPSYRTSAEIACRYTALFAQLAGAAGKNPTSAGLAKAGKKLGTVTVPGSGTITYNTKTRTFSQPVFLFRFDPATRAMVRDSEPFAAKTQ
ncbi:MAG: ABC transporter substrate-binding protein [Actinomycetota bacterium]